MLTTKQFRFRNGNNFESLNKHEIMTELLKRIFDSIYRQDQTYNQKRYKMLVVPVLLMQRFKDLTLLKIAITFKHGINVIWMKEINKNKVPTHLWH